MKVISAPQGSLEWHKLRLAKITGTKLEDVMGTPKARRKLISCLVAEEGTEQPKIVRASAEMERGTAEEVFARKAFEKKYNKKVKQVGICVSDKYPWLAYSPDGLIANKKGKFIEGVEIKNPDSATMISYRLGECKSDIGVPEDYKWQVVDAFLVNEDMERLHFVVYDARFIDDEHKMYVIVVERADPALQQALEDATERLEVFRAEWLDCRDKVLPSNF